MTRSGSMAVLAVFCLLQAPPSFASNFPPKLFLSRDGVALSQFPSRSVLNQTVQVTKTIGHGKSGWTATSDQPWLSVTPSGKTGGALTLAANTGQLAADQFYLANVTVSTSGARFSDTETLRVGLYIGSTDPTTVAFNKNGSAIATNPVTPIAYVAEGSTVYEYNVYTGAPVGSFKKVAPTIGYLEMSSDGNTLFVSDTTNFEIVAVDAGTGAFLHKYDVGYPNNVLFNMAYVRAFGRPALYLPGWILRQPGGRTGQPGQQLDYGRLMAYPSGKDLAEDVIYWGPVAATPDGTSVVSTAYGGVTDELYTYQLSIVNDQLFLRKIGAVSYDGQNCTDIAISHDGKYAFPACGLPYQFDVFDMKTVKEVGALPALPYPDNIEINSMNRIVGGINGVQEKYDVFVYSENGVLIGSLPTTPKGNTEGQQPGTMKVSGDATRVVSLTYDVYGTPQTLMFRSLP